MGNENSSSTAVYSGRIAPFGQEHGHGLAGLNAVAKRAGKKVAMGSKRNAKQAGRSRSTSNLKSSAEADSTGSANSNSSDLPSSSLETSNNHRKGSANGLVGQFIKNHHHQHLVQGSNFRKHSCSHLQQQSVQSSQSVDSGCSSSSTSVQLEVGLLSPDSTTMLLNTNHCFLKPQQGNALPHRKHSFSEAKGINNSRLGAPAANHTLMAGKGADRRRSRSLCAQQLKADCQSVAAAAAANSNNQQHSVAVMNPKKNSTASAASANLLMPSLARLRIQQCFKNAKPIVGQHILKRACSLRSEIKVFLSYLTDEKVEELATDIYVFVTECVASLEEPERATPMVQTRHATAAQKEPLTKLASNQRTSNTRIALTKANSARKIAKETACEREKGATIVRLVFVGDKGGSSTKCANGVGNVTYANSPDSLLLVSIFDDNDNYENLANLQPLFEQIKFCHIKVGEQELQVKWFLTGDLKFIDTVYGHIGSSATHPCPICESPKTAFKENNKHSKRTLFSLEQGHLRFRYNTQDGQTLAQKQQTNLHRECHSVTKSQLLQIPISIIIPPSLHLIQGLCQAIIEAIEAAEPSMVSQLEAVFVELQVDRRVWHQRFTGNHVRKLLSGEGPQKIMTVIRKNALHKEFFTLLTLLGKMQSLAKNEFLSAEEIENFHQWSATYFHTIRNAFSNWAITPKCHILCQHVIEFMKLHRFWGLLSEQSIEALHCKVNGDERRLCGIRERKKTLKKIMEVSALSKAFGQMHAALCQMGFRPEFFSTIADATIAECVRLDGGAHKRCETLLAWSQLMQFMFSNVRDGYYAEIRQQRRSSLPQHRLLLSQQQSIDVRNNCCSFDMDI